MTIDALIANIIKLGNPCAVGLDVTFRELPRDFAEGYKSEAEAVCAFNHTVIDAVYDIIPVLCVNVSSLMLYGYETLCDTISYAKEKGMFTIADAKCIGEPVAAKAEAEMYFEKLDADCVTISGYYGTLGAKPFTDRCENPEKSVFVLSCSESGSPYELQTLMAGTRTVYRAVCDRASLWGEKNTGKMGFSNIGVMLGGLEHEQFRELRRIYKRMLFLLTGYDGKRVTARDFRGAFDLRGLGGIVYVGRYITLAEGENDISASIRRAAEKVRDDLKLCF